MRLTHPLALVLHGAASLGIAGCLSAHSEPVASPSGATGAPVAFDRFEVHLGRARRPTLLTGFFSAGAWSELAWVRREGGAVRLRLLERDRDGWSPSEEVSLSPATSFVDVLRAEGRDRLLLYEPGRLVEFDPTSRSVAERVAVSSSFRRPRAQEVPHVDVTHDVNGDGREDLVVPVANGFHVFVQSSDGAFAPPVRVGRTPNLERILGADGYRFDPWSQSRVHRLDHDLDGRGDLVHWSGDRFQVHRQRADGTFSTEPEAFWTDVEFDTDDLDALATESPRGRVLHSLEDVDGDGVGDLVIHSIEGGRIPRKRSTFEVHLGRASARGGTEFARVPDITFRSRERLQLDFRVDDFDGDARPDVMLTTIELGALHGSLWKSLAGFFGGDIGLWLECYRGRAGGFAARPDAVLALGLDGAPSHREPGSIAPGIVLRGATHEARRTQRVWRKAFNVNQFLGDVTGDGRKDYLVERSFRGLAVLEGVSGPGLFASREQEVRVLVPNDEEYAWLVDLNRDGRQDVLLHHPFTERDIHGKPLRAPDSEPHRVVLLVSR